MGGDMRAGLAEIDGGLHDEATVIAVRFDRAALGMLDIDAGTRLRAEALTAG
jgi:hypothetical protein